MFYNFPGETTTQFMYQDLICVFSVPWAKVWHFYSKMQHVFYILGQKSDVLKGPATFLVIPPLYVYSSLCSEYFFVQLISIKFSSEETKP